LVPQQSEGGSNMKVNEVKGWNYQSSVLAVLLIQRLDLDVVNDMKENFEESESKS
jgi:hypothetical protein